MYMNNNFLNCSFCHKSQKKVQHIIATQHSSICDKCVELCLKALITKKKNSKITMNLLPKDIYNLLDPAIISI